MSIRNSSDGSYLGASGELIVVSLVCETQSLKKGLSPFYHNVSDRIPAHESFRRATIDAPIFLVGFSIIL